MILIDSPLLCKADIRNPLRCLLMNAVALRSASGRFHPDEGAVAGYGHRIRVKYTAKWGAYFAESIFQTRSSALRT